MRRFIPLLAFILASASCGSEPTAGSTEQASSVALLAGGAFHFYGPLALPINGAHLLAQMPFPPLRPSASSQFWGTYYITNKGGTNLTNSLSFTFRLFEPPQPALPYYTATILTEVVDRVGSFPRSAIHTVATVTLQPREWVDFYWDADGGIAYLDREDINQNVIQELTGPVAWPLGTQPTWAKSPTLNFNIMKTSTYDGCEWDMPGYDDNLLDDGHVWLSAAYSTGSPLNLVDAHMLASGPTTCSLRAQNYTGYDYVTWHTGG
jgi:hypothetical protein